MFEKKRKELALKLDVTGLSPSHLRLIRYLNATLLEVLHSTDESTYFDKCAELMKIVAISIEQAKFIEMNERACSSQISYSGQALQYSLDTLLEGRSAQLDPTRDN